MKEYAADDMPCCNHPNLPDVIYDEHETPGHPCYEKRRHAQTLTDLSNRLESQVAFTEQQRDNQRRHFGPGAGEFADGVAYGLRLAVLEVAKILTYEKEENGSLIAAAPDLLAAAMHAANLLEYAIPEADPIHAELRAAIAKATGQD